MTLRAYRPSDLEILYQIDQACFPSGVSYSREEIAGFIGHRNSRTWVAEAEGGIVGFLIAALMDDRTPQRAVHIITIDVVEAWRRRAVGDALMGAAEEWARASRARTMSLEVAEDNVAAQAFYARRGYETVERVEDYYANGMAAFVLQKQLTVNGPKLKVKG
ncbi:MAG TPA: N-acetyltransferase [Terriglobia bacterium]|nr:N-acetyltransferase [Terriglobia bacterium]